MNILEYILILNTFVFIIILLSLLLLSKKTKDKKGKNREYLTKDLIDIKEQIYENVD